MTKHPGVASAVGRRAMEKLFLRYEPDLFYRLWLNRWRIWKEWRGHRIRFQIRRVKMMLSKQTEEDVPF